MENNIEKILATVVGLKLGDLAFCGSMGMCGFGDKREVATWNGKRHLAFERSLHITCAWRIVSRDRLLVGSDDIHHLARNEPDAHHAGPKQNTREWVCSRLMAGEFGALIVRDVTVARFCALSLRFDNDIAFEAIPVESSRDPDTELWRFFTPGFDRHVVAAGGAIRIEGANKSFGVQSNGSDFENGG